LAPITGSTNSANTVSLSFEEGNQTRQEDAWWDGQAWVK
jgi:hypothetical protein